MLNIEAVPFYPMTQTCPGNKGYVLIDPVYSHLPDCEEELFNPLLFPMSQEELEELEIVEEINDLLAELDLMEAEEELKYLVRKKQEDLKANASVDSVIQNVLNRARNQERAKDLSKQKRHQKQKVVLPNRKPLHHLQQPRSVY